MNSQNRVYPSSSVVPPNVSQNPGDVANAIFLLDSRLQALEGDSTSKAVQEFVLEFLKRWGVFLDSACQSVPRILQQVGAFIHQQVRDYLGDMSCGHALLGVMIASTPVSLNKAFNGRIPLLNAWMIQGSAALFGSMLTLKLLSASTQHTINFVSSAVGEVKQSVEKRHIPRRTLIFAGALTAGVGILYCMHILRSKNRALSAQLIELKFENQALKRDISLSDESLGAARNHARGLAMSLGLIPAAEEKKHSCCRMFSTLKGLLPDDYKTWCPRICGARECKTN